MILQTNFLLLIVLLVNSRLLSFEFAEFLIERKLILEQMIFFKQRVCKYWSHNIWVWRPRFCYQGNLCCIYCYCYVSRHPSVEGTANITFKKFPRRITLALGKKKRKRKNWPIDRPGGCSSE